MCGGGSGPREDHRAICIQSIAVEFSRAGWIWRRLLRGVLRAALVAGVLAACGTGQSGSVTNHRRGHLAFYGQRIVHVAIQSACPATIGTVCVDGG